MYNYGWALLALARGLGIGEWENRIRNTQVIPGDRSEVYETIVLYELMCAK